MKQAIEGKRVAYVNTQSGTAKVVNLLGDRCAATGEEAEATAHSVLNWLEDVLVPEGVAGHNSSVRQ